MKYKIKATHIAKKIISVLVIWAFLFDPRALLAYQEFQTSNLAPQLATAQPSYRDKILAAEIVLSHEAHNAYIADQIKKIIETKGEGWILGLVDSGQPIPITGLLTNTGSLAHVGLGRQYNKAVVYIDADVFNNERDRADILSHEADEESGWENVRVALGTGYKKEFERSDMRDWVIRYIDTPDERLKGTKYTGMSSRQIGKMIHGGSHKIDHLYRKYGSKIDINTQFLLDLLLKFDGKQREENDLFTDLNNSRDVVVAAYVVKPNGEPGSDPRKYGLEKVRAIAKSLMPRAEGGRTWVEENIRELAGKTMFTISLEGNIPEFSAWPNIQNANTKGGLGAYFGDKFEGLDRIGMIASGAQPGYMFDRDGNYVDYDELAQAGALKEVKFAEDIAVWTWIQEDHVLFDLINGHNWIRGKESWDFFKDWCIKQTDGNILIRIKVYEVVRKGVKRYIFVSPVFDKLYTEDRNHRFSQEVSFGKAAYQFLKKMNFVPDILHLNEGHAVVAASEMRADPKFDRTSIVATDHTPVEAGHEKFEGADINRMTYILGEGCNIFRDKFIRLKNGGCVVDFSSAVIELADVRNGVSKEHADVTAKLFEGIMREKTGADSSVSIIPVLNGSGDVWVNEKLLKYQAAGEIPTEDELYDIHEEAKAQVAFKEIELRTGVKLDPNKLTNWMVRRLTEYKSQYPMLRFLAHIMCADTDQTFTREQLMDIWQRDILSHMDPGDGSEWKRPYNQDLHNKLPDILKNIFTGRKVIHGLGMQVVIAGPEYESHWVSEFKRWMELPGLKGRFVYVPQSDTQMLKMQAIGSDICTNMPRPLDEACGTSDQRAGRNGGVAISPAGMGSVEWITNYNSSTQDGSGFLFGSFTAHDEYGKRVAKWDSFYKTGPGRLLRKCKIASNLFYKTDEDGRPDKSDWKHLMFNSYTASTYGVYVDRGGNLVKKKSVTAQAMEERYARDVYLPAVLEKSDTKTINEMVIRDYCEYDGKGGIKASGLKSARKDLEVKARNGVKYISLIGLMKHVGAPFEIMDPFTIDERAGSVEDLEHFVETAHALGMKVLMDWQANQHVAKSSYICAQYPEQFLYTNVSDGNYRVGYDISTLVRGSSIPSSELKRRIRNGNRINELMKEIREKGAELPNEGFFDVYGEKISFWKADENTRKQLNGYKAGSVPVVVLEKDALFLMSATDLVATDKAFPRRWEKLAQPDLGFPEVADRAVEIGRFWLSNGIDGFRVDAALSNFPDRVMENWGIKVKDNLTVRFLREMRAVNHNCFFLFEGHERQNELLALADNRNCACYSWEARTYTTEALIDRNKIGQLLGFLNGLQNMRREERNQLVNLGTEYDSADFRNPDAILSYQDKNLMYLLYMFIPGFRVIFDGEVYGSSYGYRNDAAISGRAPRAADADKAKMAVRQTILSLPKLYRTMSSGSYACLDSTVQQNGIALARYDEEDIFIGVINCTYDSGWTTLSLRPVIEKQRARSGKSAAGYNKISYKLGSDGARWVETDTQFISEDVLYNQGLGVNVGPKGGEIVRLVRVDDAAVTSGKGSPIKGLKAMYEKKVFRENAMTVKELSLLRGYSQTTVRVELGNLVRLGLVKEDRSQKEYSYYLTEVLARAPPWKAQNAIIALEDIEIKGVKILDLYTVPEDKFDIVNVEVRAILSGLPSASKEAPSAKREPLAAGIAEQLDKDFAFALEALRDSGGISAKLKDGHVYVIRINQSRLSEVPYGVSIIKAYVELLKMRASDPENIILKYSNAEGLISVQSYKDRNDYNGDRLYGKGTVNVAGQIKDKQVNLPGLFNMAMAAANIRLSLPAGQTYDEYELGLIETIRNQYKQIYGTDLAVADQDILAFLKDLPAIDKPLPVDSIESYYKLTYQKLQQAA